MESKVSVVIPVYNVEPYIAHCLDSVIHQTYKNLEIICVNDCSPDHSAEILKEYASKDNRIKIINREKNGGLSAARNTGMDVATGEYIYFLDSDDWIDLEYIEKMVTAIKSHDAELVVNTNIIAETSTGSEPFLWDRYKKQLTEGEFLDKVEAVNNSPCMIWCHLYKKSFLDNNNLRFPEGYIHEDEYFQHISKNLLDKVFIFYGSAYHYLQRTSSIMGSRKSKIYAYVRIFRLIYLFYKDHKLLNSDIRIKLFQLCLMFDAQTEEEFVALKEYVALIEEDFKKCRMASFDFDKYIYNIVKDSHSLADYKDKVHGNKFYAVYLTVHKMRRHQKGKISVVIPVYHVEKYLRHCLDSVCAQTLEDIEIICVNDCSPDHSAEILKEYASKDNRIKIINREKNGGLSAARNTGMDVATGEYIYFLDSDDWIDLDYLEQMEKTAAKGQYDIIQNLSVVENYENGAEKNYPLQIKEEGEIDQVTALNKTPVMTWTHLFKRDFLQKYSLKFPEGFIHEDIYFHHITKSKADKIFIFRGGNYHYFQRENSIIYSRKSKILPMIKISEKVLDYYLGNDIKNKNKICLLNFATIEEIQTEEEFKALKVFLQKLLSYYKQVSYQLSDFEEFAIDEICNAFDFEAFKSKNKSNLRLAYLRKNMKGLRQ